MFVLKSFPRSGALAAAVAIAGLIASTGTVSAGAGPSFNPFVDYRFVASVPVSGTAKPYTLSMDVFGQGGTGSLTIQLTRTATTGNKPEQLHTWYIQNVAYACHSNLSSCTLDTGTHMGVAGSITLSFAPSAASHSRQIRCDFGPHKLLETLTTRKGHMVGDLELATGTGYFGTVRNGSGPVHVSTAIKGKAEKENLTDNMCTGGTFKCQKSYEVDSGDGSLEAWRPAGHGLGQATFDVIDSISGGDLTLDHMIRGSAPASFLTVNEAKLKKLTVNLRATAPFLSGTATFTQDAPFSAGSGSCSADTRLGTLTGSVAGHFDGWGTRALSLPAPGIAVHDH